MGEFIGSDFAPTVANKDGSTWLVFEPISSSDAYAIVSRARYYAPDRSRQLPGYPTPQKRVWRIEGVDDLLVSAGSLAFRLTTASFEESVRRWSTDQFQELYDQRVLTEQRISPT